MKKVLLSLAVTAGLAAQASGHGVRDVPLSHVFVMVEKIMGDIEIQCDDTEADRILVSAQYENVAPEELLNDLLPPIGFVFSKTINGNRTTYTVTRLPELRGFEFRIVQTHAGPWEYQVDIAMPDDMLELFLPSLMIPSVGEVPLATRVSGGGSNQIEASFRLYPEHFANSYLVLKRVGSQYGVSYSFKLGEWLDNSQQNAGGVSGSGTTSPGTPQQ